MPTYVFKGRNRLNEIVVGERVADNREALRQTLRREQVTLTSVKEKGREIGIPKIGSQTDVWEWFSEINVPLWESASGNQRADLQQRVEPEQEQNRGARGVYDALEPERIRDLDLL